MLAHETAASSARAPWELDPLGFALENFDVIGAWRDRYADRPIDASGRIVGGQSFDGPIEFKDALLAKKELFVRAFIEQMLAYALGRELTAFDDPVVTAILDDVRPSGYPFQEIVLAIVRSDPFRQTNCTRKPSR